MLGYTVLRKFIRSYILKNTYFINKVYSPQSRTLQPVRGEGYEPAYKSKANAETHPKLGREVMVFQKGGEKLYTRRVSLSKNNLPPVLQPLN